MPGEPASRVLILSLCVALGALAAGCRKKDDPATAATRQALEEVKGQVTKLRKDAADLRARVAALPDNAPGADAVRAKLSAVEEVLGTEAARAEWMAGELASAIASGSKEKVAQISETIHASVEGSKRLAKPVIDLGKELLPLEGSGRAPDAGSGG